MIELYKYTVHSTDNIVELRNKVLILTQAIHFDYTNAVRIATGASELFRQLLEQANAPTISIGFDKLNGRYALCFDCMVHCDSENLKNAAHYFGQTSLTQADKSARLRVTETIHDDAFRPKEAFLQTLRETLVRQSKAELMKEIAQKNEEMAKLLEDLKKSSGLIQSEKMRALGTLTAGVAHELNNPMMGIINFIQYCLKHTEKHDRCYDALKDAEFETKRCIDIVKNLLTFSHLEKEGAEAFHETNINTIIERVIKILTYRIHAEKVDVKANLLPDLPSIMGQENRLQQVVLNIVTNAFDAMKIREEKKLTIESEIEDKHVKISFTDTGGGIDTETREQIFEPFFTTKPTGLGTGLGLSLCDSIVKEHHGKLLCDSIIRRGTTFTILLPIEFKHEGIKND